MNLSPIALFTYNRLRHTLLTVEALRGNELAAESDLFVFSDGPRTKGDRENVVALRQYLKTIRDFKRVTVVERDRNLGLAQSIITGVTEIVSAHGRIIVLEDDMVTSPYFLKYMNEALEFYRDEERVISVHGYIYPVKAKLPETFFLRGADCWGWATWARGWRLFEADGGKLLAELTTRKLTQEFDFDGSYIYTRTLREQVEGKNDSWAIRWYASAFLRGKLTLYPGRSLVKNIGNDASGTHCPAWDIFDTQVTLEPVRIERVPVAEDPDAKKEVGRFLKCAAPGLAKNTIRRVKTMFKRRMHHA